MLDAFAGLEQELRSYESVYAEWKEALNEYHELLDQKAKRSQETDYLEFLLKDIISVKPNRMRMSSLLQKKNTLPP
jgi:DNA repair ATPase RecN